MKKYILAVTLALASVANAATLSFSPTAQTIDLGDTTSVAVQVSDLAVDQAIGAYQLRVLFSASILDATSITFSDRLGAAFLSDSITPVGAAEASFLSNETGAVLLALQATSPFTLFTINFTGIGLGVSPLTFELLPRDLSDQDGNLLASVVAQTGSITVRGDTTPEIPEPSMFLPVILAAGAAWFVRRKHA